MVCVYHSVGVGAALLAIAGVATAAAATPGMSLELHRLPSAVIDRNAAYQRQRRLKSSGDSFETVPLHLGMGTHYTWVYAGTPPQRASVITDTGSSIMAFPCVGCDHCGDHTDKPFDKNNSSTLTHVTCSDPTFFRCQGCGGMADTSQKTCEISQSYMEGSSWQATVVEDIVFLGGEDSFRDVAMRDTFGTHFRFGCQQSETGLFITQVADGIMGLANNDHHIIAKLYKEKKIPNKLFSLCFAAEGGAMSIGAPDTSRHKGEIAYAKLIKTVSHDFYGVELREVRVAGTRVEVAPTTFQYGQYIVDSGTTDSYLPSSMKKAFQEAFKKVSGLDYHVSSSACQGYTEEQLDKLPNFEFILGAQDGGNLTLVVTPDQYLLQEATGKYCASVFLSESSGGVIGANIMMDHDVIFDQGNNRVGFVRADCDYKRSPTSEKPAGNGSASAAPAATTVVPAPTATATATTLNATLPPTNTKVVNSTVPAPPTTTTPSPSPSATAVTSAPTEAPTTAPPSVTPSDLTESPAPSSTSESNATGKLTSKPPPTSAAPTPTTETPATTAPSTMPLPTTTNKSVDLAAKSSTNKSNDNDDEGEDQPIVLTIVGTVLAVAFILAAVLSVRRHKRTKRARKYGRVKGNEGEEEDEDDDEEDLMAHTPGQRTTKKLKMTPVSDDVESEEEDEEDEDEEDTNVRHGGRVSGRAIDDDEDEDYDDDDDIFDRDVDQHKPKHDARMLEQL